jgi:predicted nucleotidyltransferase
MPTTQPSRASGEGDATLYFRTLLETHRDQLDEVLRQYGATNPRIFGSVARGDATPTSDIDVLVDLEANAGNELLRVSGVAEGFRRILHVDVDVITESLMREGLAAHVHDDLVAM